MQIPTPYYPKPIPVEDVQLSPDLKRLVEHLAENAHDVWAQCRFADGWKFGPERNDALRCHPCLVPYRDLPESEKNYDRELVEQTLRTILKLGYEIRMAVR